MSLVHVIQTNIPNLEILNLAEQIKIIMLKFLHYQQHDAMDCGPTCLCMVAKHYGRPFSIQKLREVTQIGKEGFHKNQI